MSLSLAPIRPTSCSFQILVGDYGLSPDQQRMQVAIWCVLASPLLLSADVRAATSRPEFHQLLLNPRVLAISQDPLGIMGKQVMVVRSQPIAIIRSDN